MIVDVRLSCTCDELGTPMSAKHGCALRLTATCVAKEQGAVSEGSRVCCQACNRSFEEGSLACLFYICALKGVGSYSLSMFRGHFVWCVSFR